ncbi:NADPH:quinone reductase [Vanrija albida]|uniref:NADPH:quinone reductase n=1 Tax=Vanrija albida TaxID=181172 RepID=A0ABR3Q8Y7_9TREE
MHACFEKTGGPEVSVLAEVPVPTPKADEVLLKVEWTGANFIDNYRRSGLYTVPLPYVQGQDIVGTIVQLPSSGGDLPLGPLKVGQRVFTTAGHSFAEYAVAPAWQVAPLPDSIDAKDGVSLATVTLTALTLLREAYPVQKGDYVLVRAAAGGVGLVLVQLAKAFGAHVVGTVSTPEKAQQAREAGADLVLLSSAPSEENVKQIVEWAGGKGVHAVYDGIGKDTWEEDFLVVRPKATIVTYGNASGPVPPFSPLKLTPKVLKVTRPSLFPFIDNPEDFARYAREAVQLAQDGKVKFAVHKVYPFSEEGVRQTQVDISSRGTTGKLLIQVS